MLPFEAAEHASFNSGQAGINLVEDGLGVSGSTKAAQRPLQLHGDRDHLAAVTTVGGALG